MQPQWQKEQWFTMYSIPDKFQFKLEEPFLHEKLFIGSQYGWLIVLDQHCEPFLFNPLTGESIPLPSITTLLTVRPCHSITGDIVSYFAIIYCFIEDSSPFSYYTHEDYLREITFKKVVISSNPSVVSSNFVAAALVGLVSDLVGVGPDKGTWNLLREEELYMDIMFR
ncbi:hypothetical protein FCM35_KLT04145 [Carex littledalei]|uniref:KIB1-4 beta-propeller domain-containing protein n=1 Tax=Carex littledalei TaxID=544730 RepID=A0A833VAD6_9POAL|nr:hypothetical protein FCM35_KLT04145 [Carex littledalei]